MILPGDARLREDPLPPAPRVSVVVPLYNAERWIGETLGSVLAQTYDPGLLEVVVVDDGSTDRGVAAAAEALSGARSPYKILSGKNGGPSVARNRGWREAGGEWVQFLDADDLMHPAKVAVQARAAGEAGPEVASVCSEWQRLGERGGEWRPVGGVSSGALGDDAPAALLRPDTFLHVGAQLFRRSWLERVSGFDERYWMIEDVDLLLRLATAGGRFLHAPGGEPLFLYRQHGASLSQRDPRAFVEGCLRNARLAHDAWTARGELTPERADVLAGVYFFGARFFAAEDPAGFGSLVETIERLVPGFVPAAPPSLRILSRVCGYRRAERIAGVYRRLRGAAVPAPRAASMA